MLNAARLRSTPLFCRLILVCLQLPCVRRPINILLMTEDETDADSSIEDKDEPRELLLSESSVMLSSTKDGFAGVAACESPSSIVARGLRSRAAGVLGAFRRRCPSSRFIFCRRCDVSCCSSASRRSLSPSMIARFSSSFSCIRFDHRSV